MRQQFILSCTLFAFALLVACGKQTPGLDTYDIPYQEKVTFDKDKKLLFSDVLFDNRCPIDVACITGGEVIVEFQALENTDTMTFSLHLGPDATGPTDTVILVDYHIELLEVYPLPLAGVEVEKDDYECRVLIEKVP